MLSHLGDLAVWRDAKANPTTLGTQTPQVNYTRWLTLERTYNLDQVAQDLFAKANRRKRAKDMIAQKATGAKRRR